MTCGIGSTRGGGEDASRGYCVAGGTTGRRRWGRRRRRRRGAAATGGDGIRFGRRPKRYFVVPRYILPFYPIISEVRLRQEVVNNPLACQDAF